MVHAEVVVRHLALRGGGWGESSTDQSNWERAGWAGELNPPAEELDLACGSLAAAVDGPDSSPAR